MHHVTTTSSRISGGTVDKNVFLHWHEGDEHVDFRRLPLTHPTLARGGVYVIHRSGRPYRLGQATRIADRLRAHQQDPRVAGACEDRLSVAWALVPRAYRDGVEAYLGKKLLPDVAERFPSAPPIAVNLPATCVVPKGRHRDVSLAGGEGLAYPSRFTRNEMMENDETRQREALETLAHLHAKDAKNSNYHDADECAMCGVFEQLHVGQDSHWIARSPRSA